VGVSNSVVFALLSDLQDEYGFGDVGLGLIAGSGFLVGLLGMLLLAPLADRGHAKTLMVAGLLVAFVGSVCFAVAPSLPWLVAARCVVGLSNSLFDPASRAVVIGMSGNDVAARLGRLSGVELAGFVSGPVIGGLLIDPFGLAVPFLVTGLFALAGAVMLWFQHVPEPPRTTSNRLAFDLLRLPRIRVGVLMAVALFAPVGFYDAVLDRFMTDLGASNKLISLAFVAYGIPFALLASKGGALADRHGPLRVCLVSAVLVAPIVAVYGFITAPVLVVGLSAIEGIVNSGGIPGATALVARAAPEGRAAAAQGLSGAASILCGAITAYSAGWVYQAVGARGMFAIAAAAVLGLTALALAQHRRAQVS
jgi:MFS family permease